MNCSTIPRSVKFTGGEYARVRQYALSLTLLVLAGSAIHTTCAGDITATAAVADGAATSSTLLGGLWWLSTLSCLGMLVIVMRLRKQVRRATRLGQYELQHKLGEGGMGVVYRAHHAMLKRPTAVKLLRPEKTGEINFARFEREVRLTAQLSHPNIVTVYDYGRTPEGQFFYAMELVEGATLDEAVAVGGALPPNRVIHLLRQVASALREAHDHGLIHRDIKPSNVILAPRDSAKLVDFGLVKELDNDGDAPLTADSCITGTPLYMTPEMILSPAEVDHRSDIYALGAIGYFLLCGEHVFESDSLIEVCSGHLHETPRPPSERLGTSLPADLETLLLRCLQKDPDDRPQSANEILEALSACRDAGSWDEDDAKLWWNRHQRDLQRQHPPLPLDSGRHRVQVAPAVAC
jgi:serine/threonine protein kinase